MALSAPSADWPRTARADAEPHSRPLVTPTKRTFSAVATEATPSEKGGHEFKELGLTLAPLSKDLASRFELEEDVNGLVVTGVDDDSNASEKGLQPGDIIVEINQEKVKSLEDVQQQVEKADKAGRRSVLLLVKFRQGEDPLRFVPLRLQKKGG